ncbi:MAG: lycopene cyclase family protein [Bacillota bacterium]
MAKWDVIIVGAGPAGIFAAIELVKKAPGLSVLMLEKGRSLEARNCPRETASRRVRQLLAVLHHLGLGWGRRFQRRQTDPDHEVWGVPRRVSGGRRAQVPHRVHRSPVA